MKTIKGPAIFLAQFLGDDAPFNKLESICKWAKSLGYIGVQIPTWDARCIDLKKAAESKTYADEIRGIVNDSGLEITELSTHLQGQLVAVHPAYDELFDGFAPEAYRKNPVARQNMGSSAIKICGHRFKEPGTQCPCKFQRCIALANILSLATKTGRTG